MRFLQHCMLCFVQAPSMSVMRKPPNGEIPPRYGAPLWHSLSTMFTVTPAMSQSRSDLVKLPRWNSQPAEKLPPSTSAWRANRARSVTQERNPGGRRPSTLEQGSRAPVPKGILSKGGRGTGGPTGKELGEGGIRLLRIPHCSYSPRNGTVTALNWKPSQGRGLSWER